MSGSSAERLGARSSSAASASRARSAAARASAAAASASASSDEASATSCSREAVSTGAIVEVAAQPRHDDLRRLRLRDRVGCLADRVGFERREAPELGSELARLLCAEREARGERLLEARRRIAGPSERRFEAGGEVEQPAEQPLIDVAPAQVRDRGERLLRRGGDRCGLGRGLGCDRRPAGELVGLVGEGAATCIHLEQHRLGRLARKPELAPFTVVAMALRRDHGSMVRFEQAIDRYEPDAVEQAESGRVACGELAERARTLDGRGRRGGGVAIDDDGEAAEPVTTGALEQLEPAPRVTREHRRCAPGERSRDRVLRARLGLESRERERLAGRGEGAGSRRNPFPLLDRTLECLQPLAGRARPLGDVVALRGRGSGRCSRIVRARLELGRARALLGTRSHAPRRARRDSVSTSVAADSRRNPRRSRAAPRARRCLFAPSRPPVASASAASTAPRSARSSASRDSAPRERPRSYAATREWASAGPLRGLAVRLGRVTRSSGGRLRRSLEAPDCRVAAVGSGALGLDEVVPQPLLQPRGRFAPKHKSLARALQAIESTERRLAAPRRIRQLVLGQSALLEKRGELLLCSAARDCDGVAACLRVGPALCHRGEIELRDARPQGGDLDAELLGPLGRGRLQRQRPQPLAHLLLDVPRPLDLRRDAGELQLGPVPAALELAEPGGLLDEVAPVLRLRREHRVDLALGDDRVHRAAETDICEQLDEIRAANGRPVDEVLALAAADEAARNRDLAEVDLVAEAPVVVVEDELHLAVVGSGPGRRAAEEDVVGLLRPELRRCQRSCGPDDRVGDVRLPGAVRADDDGHPRLELQLDRVDERLEAADPDGLEMHVPRTLTARADGAGRVGRSPGEQDGAPESG